MGESVSLPFPVSSGCLYSRNCIILISPSVVTSSLTLLPPSSDYEDPYDYIDLDGSASLPHLQDS